MRTFDEYLCEEADPVLNRWVFEETAHDATSTGGWLDRYLIYRADNGWNFLIMPSDEYHGKIKSLKFRQTYSKGEIWGASARYEFDIDKFGETTSYEEFKKWVKKSSDSFAKKPEHPVPHIYSMPSKEQYEKFVQAPLQIQYKNPAWQKPL